MQINNILPQIDKETIENVLQKYQIEVPEDFNFAPISIIVGPNGSGKTRLLQAMKEILTLDEGADIIYGYFPGLSDKKTSLKRRNVDLPKYTLFESLHMKEASFSDFLKEIETHNDKFIPELLEYGSQHRKMLSDKAKKTICDSFYSLTGKELVFQTKKIYVKGSKDFNKPLSTALSMLSPGELNLFYISIFIAIQENRQKDKIIILDEPESHLHPKALINFVRILIKQDYKYIWIATHSLYLVPEFKFENIVYICDGVVQKRTSQMYERVYSELLGDEDGKVKMFFSSMSQWKYCEFIAECFTNPTVMETINPNDKQVQLFIHYLENHKPFRVLDCGGGSGRLGLSLEAAQIGESGNIDYDIYDRRPSYTGNEFDVYTDLSDIKDFYDCIVMMNFLHEVEPKEWIQLFCNIYSLLKDKAYLLFVEVNALAQGEKPNSVGYLILGKEELELLFNAQGKLTEIAYEEKQKSSCILIPRDVLINITDYTIINSIRHLEERTLKEIQDIRKKEINKEGIKNSATARYYAFLTQQYLNAKLFMCEQRTQAIKTL